MAYNYLFNNPTQPFVTFTCEGGDQYTSDGTGTIIVPRPTQKDIENLVNSGFVQLSAFGGGSAGIYDAGNIYASVSGAGIIPGATAADNVLAVYSLPAGSLDGIRNREIILQANGVFGNNTNSKRVKLIIGATAAVVGSTITGGVTVADTGAYTTTGAAGFQITGSLIKYGVLNSNTQLGMCNGILIANASIGLGTAGNPQAMTLVENAPILIAVTGNAATTASDIALNFFGVSAFN